jgi:hypothetical protein
LASGRAPLAVVVSPDDVRDVPHTSTTANSANDELAGLLDRQRQLEARVSEVAAEERAALAAAEAASDALVALEREAAVGAKAAARRGEAEDRLLQAKTAAMAPWSDRRKAAELAVTDARAVVAHFIAANLDPLLANLAERGEQAARALDAAAEALVAAYEERQASGATPST